MHLLVPTLLLGSSLAAADELRIDAVADEPAWEIATRLPALAYSQPETGLPFPHPTEVRMLATEAGLAFFFACDQPESVPRRAQRQQRDQLDAVDRVNVMLDIEGSGQRGYNFTVARSGSIEDATISNENLFNKDWDGDWQHAVREREGGYDVELRIPWSTMFSGSADQGRREIGVYVDRVLGSSGERAAHPPIAFSKPRFLSLFARFPVDVRDAALLRFYPYLSTRQDLVGDIREFAAGVDLSYKPHGRFQLTATLRPDFGQVESDDLVVNFDAVESFFSDKRPFFTENQAPFVLQSPEEEPLVYTRRIGALRDDGLGAAEIDAGIKLNGSHGGVDYGLFSVRERDADRVGRQFSVLRLALPGERGQIGYLGTRTERPFLARRADVHAVDGQWRQGGLVLRGVLLQSGIDEGAARQRGHGGWATLQWRPGPAFDLRLDSLYFGPGLDFNDLGFQRRLDYRLHESRLSWHAQNPDAGAGHWRTQRIDWDIDWAEDAAGRTLRPATGFNLYREHHDGGFRFVSVRAIRAGIDDLISRGNGPVHAGGGLRLFAEHGWARRGAWRPYVSAFVSSDDVIGNNREGSVGAVFFLGEAASLDLGAFHNRRSDRLYWREGTRFGRYRAEQSSLDANLEWFVGQRQELRVKFQWVSFTAFDGRELRLLPDGGLRRTGALAEDFGFASFGVQVRYRYRLGPESDLYVVYARGGDLQTDAERRGFGVLADTLDQRASEQWVVKLRYAF